VLSLFLGLACGQPVKPHFEDYRVSRVYRGPVKPPKVGNLNQFTGTDLRCFGDLERVGEAVNFAGHFVVGACTCGSGCHYLFLWDAITGRFYSHLPFHSINVGPYGIGGTDSPIEYKGEKYRADSRLLIVEACIEGTCDCATWYYSWNGEQFKLILKRRVRMPSTCLK